MDVEKYSEKPVKRRHVLRKLLAFIVCGAAISILYKFLRWKYIVIHHSAGNFGNLKLLQRVKYERQGGVLRMMSYHFVIGNGNGMELGEIAYDNRWRYQFWGAHVSANNMNLNLRGIGVCLVGNFERYRISEEQYNVLVELTLALMHKYHIPSDRVYLHGKINGEHTRCPGKKFPGQRFYKDIQA